MRVFYIDGIRGWAAFMVVLFHFFRESFVNIFPFISSSWLYLFLNGHLMVSIFFIISGDALSFNFFKNKSLKPISAIVLQRYIRLTVPVFFSCLLVYFLMSFNFNYGKELGVIVRREDWYGSFLNFNQSILSLVRFSFRDVYFNYDKASSYNPFLWTMSVEAVGSLIVFSVLLVLNEIDEENKKSFLGWLCIFVFLVSPACALFVFGIFLGFMRSKKCNINFMSNKIHLFVFVAVAVFSSVAACFEYKYSSFFKKIIDGVYFNAILAAIFVNYFYSTESMKKFFSSELSVFMGKISFPLYVFHFPVMISIYSGLIIYFYKLDGLFYPVKVLIIGAASIAVVVLISWLWCFFEKFYLKEVKRITGKIYSAGEK